MIRLNYLCAVEGQQESLYLRHLAKLLTDSPKVAVTFNIKIGNAISLKRERVQYDMVCLFDHDGNVREFEDNLSECIRMNKSYSKSKPPRNVYHAYSNICFDLWLLLHKKDYTRPEINNNAYVKHIRETYGLSTDDDIKDQRVMQRILRQISITDVMSAIKRADQICRNKDERDGKDLMGIKYYPNPDLSIHTFVKHVIDLLSDRKN